MSAPRILLVSSPDWSRTGLEEAQAALAATTPWAQVEVAPAGTLPDPGVAGVWLLPPPADAPADVHDPTIGAALHLGIPLLGSLGTQTTDDGGSPAGRRVGGRRGRELVSAPGTVWRDGTPDGSGRLVQATGHPFAVLTEEPLAWTGGAHPWLAQLGLAVGARVRQVTPPPPRGTGLAPYGDDGIARSYVHQMRARGYRWWRPVLALGAGIVSYAAMMFVLSAVWYLLSPESLEAGPDVLDVTDPVTMLMTNLSLAALIPATMIATRVGHWRPMGRLWSVAGRIRWGWLARASLVTLVVWGAYLVAMWFVSGEEPSARPEHVGWLLLITLLTTPLQAAGEEVAFRGGLLQGVGAWIRNPVVALVVGAVLSTVFFAVAHTSFDPWILLELGSMAACACYLTWRTGGLEAAIALHVVNNLVITVGLLLVGGLADAYVSPETTSDPLSGLVGAGANVLMTLILLHQARRAGVAPSRRWVPAEG